MNIRYRYGIRLCIVERIRSAFAEQTGFKDKKMNLGKIYDFSYCAEFNTMDPNILYTFMSILIHFEKKKYDWNSVFYFNLQIGIISYINFKKKNDSPLNIHLYTVKEFLTIIHNIIYWLSPIYLTFSWPF